jgi:hypothetical protein
LGTKGGYMPWETKKGCLKEEAPATEGTVGGWGEQTESVGVTPPPHQTTTPP